MFREQGRGLAAVARATAVPEVEEAPCFPDKDVDWMSCPEPLLRARKSATPEVRKESKHVVTHDRQGMISQYRARTCSKTMGSSSCKGQQCRW